MKRIDIVYNVLKKLDKGTGVSTSEIASESGFSRANVSSELNKLYRLGEIEKFNSTRPVLYKLKKSSKFVCKSDIFDKFCKCNASLNNCFKQAKAAVLYPPSGMNMLLLGETGVGKSMFARIIYEYAVEIKRLNKESPFIVFNCADYTNNKELLLSQLFGVKKGSFTGANSDKSGLIEEADNGILFLDEVHRLSSEGQEMLFTFLDRGVFRRLGETTTERVANVLIILATTEDPNTSLLKTFTRRIPMVINIPNLKERTMEERFNLISTFFKEESKSLKLPIKVSINALRSFISYDCPNNIGQLKTDIKLTCAKAYADLISQGKTDICIGSYDVLPHILEGLYKEIESRDIWYKIIDVTKRYCIFNYEEDNILFNEKIPEIDVYELIEIKMNELVSQGIKSEKVANKLSFEIDNYLYKYFSKYYVAKDIKHMENLVGINVVNTINEIINYAENKIDKIISKRTFMALCIHVDKAIKRVQADKNIINPKLLNIEKEFRLEFNISLDCLKIIEKNFHVSMPRDEAGFLAIILSHETKDNNNKTTEHKEVLVVIIAHGKSTATSMAEVVNSLLYTDTCFGIDAALDKNLEEVLKELKELVKKQSNKKDLLLLVDMGSLINLGLEIKKEFDIDVKTIPLVSTLHAVEAIRKSLKGNNLTSIYKDTLAVNSFMNTISDPLNTQISRSKYQILAVCSTGVGGAKVIIDILKSKLNYNKDLFELVSIKYTSDIEIDKAIKAYKKVIFIVSAFTFTCTKPLFTLQELISGTCINSMQDLINIETTYNNISDFLKDSINNIDPDIATKHAKDFIDNTMNKLKVEIESRYLIGIVFHIVSMLDRIKIANTGIKFYHKEEYIKKNTSLYKVIEHECSVLNNLYSVSIPKDEICYLMNLLNPLNFNKA